MFRKRNLALITVGAIGIGIYVWKRRRGGVQDDGVEVGSGSGSVDGPDQGGGGGRCQRSNMLENMTEVEEEEPLKILPNFNENDEDDGDRDINKLKVKRSSMSDCFINLFTPPTKAKRQKKINLPASSMNLRKRL